MIKKILLSLISTIVLLPAQTLQSSVESVLNSNPIVLENLANYREISKDLSIARSEYYPTLDLISSAGVETTNSEELKVIDGESLNYYENSLTLMFNIFDGFGTTNRIDYEKMRVLSSAYSFIKISNDMALEATKAYLEAIKQRELLVTAQENVDINEEIFIKIKELYSIGITSKSEMRKVESSLFLARSNFVIQKNNTMDSVFNFKKLLGEEVDLNTLEIPSFNLLLPKTLDVAKAYSLTHNPSMMISDFNIKSSQYFKKQNQKNYYPRVDLMAQQNLDKNTYGVEDERNRFRAGVVLTYNIYRGGADSENVQKSVSKINRDIQAKNQTKRELIEEVELSWSANMMRKERLTELYKYRSFSEETLNLYKEEYDIGRRNLLDLLSAQNDFINSKSQIVKANYEALLAKYRILNSMGLLVNAIMGNEYEYLKKVGLVGVDATDNEDTLPEKYN